MIFLYVISIRCDFSILSLCYLFFFCYFFIFLLFFLFFVAFFVFFFFFQAEDGIRDHCVTGVQTCALPISGRRTRPQAGGDRPAGRVLAQSDPRRKGRRDAGVRAGVHRGPAACHRRLHPQPERRRSMRARWRVAALAGVLTVGFGWSTAAGRSLNVIRDRGVLSLCAHADALPFASKTQDPPGFQIELGRALAAQPGLALAVEWVTSGLQFRAVDCDIALDTIAVPEAQRERRLDLSKPYRRSGVGLATRPDGLAVRRFEDLIGRRVAVQSRSLAAMLLGQRGVRLSTFGFEEEMLEAVARQEVDAAAVSPATVGYFNLRHPDAPLRFVHAYETEPELGWNLAVGLRRADPALREAIDGAIDRLVTDGTIEKIYARYGIEYRAPR